MRGAIDVDAILESAGADLHAAEGSQSHALALVGVAFNNLFHEARRCVDGVGDKAQLRALLNAIETSDADNLPRAIETLGEPQ